VRPPDTDIPCAICGGTGVNPVPLPHECGACFEFGLSTAPWDQRRTGHTITLWDGDPPRIPHKGETGSPGAIVSRMIGMKRQTGRIWLVSYPNPNYRPPQ